MMTDGLGESQYEIKRYVNDILGKEENKWKYIRFYYPSMDCFGIDKDFTLLKTIGAETKVDGCKSDSMLGEVYSMLVHGYYRLVEVWRIEIDREFFKKENYNIYSSGEILDECKDLKDVKEIIDYILKPLNNSEFILENTINYSWFDYRHGIINTPIMIDVYTVRVFVKDDIDAYKLFEWFRDDDSGIFAFSSIGNIVHGDNDTPGYIEFKLSNKAIEVLGKARDKRLFTFPIKINKVG